MTRLSPLSPPLIALIDALAEKLVEDYLQSQAAASNDSAPMRLNPVPLPTTIEAA